MLPNRLERLPRHALPGGLTVFEAIDWRAQLLGLMLLDRLPPEHALLFRRCGSVHTFGMRFPIDLAFLDRRGAVVRLVSEAMPQRVFAACAGHAVLETGVGQAGRFLGVGVGELHRR